MSTQPKTTKPQKSAISRYSGNEAKYIKKAIEGEHWSATSGTWTETLEKQFAKVLGAKHAIAMNSGTSTLHAALLALGVGPGDEVIVPSLGPIMTSAAVIHAGATPIFADIDERTFNIDPDDVKRKCTPLTKAIMPVHLYGLPCSIVEDTFFANRLGMPFVEDCAQSVLSTIGKKNCGTFGAFGSFSFEASKHLSCGEGGMLITNDERLAESARKIGGHGFKNLTADSGRVRSDPEVFQSPDYKRHSKIGYNYRLSELLSAVALAQLERINELVKVRRDSALCMIDAMKGSKVMIPQSSEGNSFWALAVRFLGDWATFRKAWIAAGGHPFFGAWSVPYDEPAYSGVIPGRSGNRRMHPANCPVAERVQPQILQFKTNWYSMEDAQKQADILKKVLKGFE